MRIDTEDHGGVAYMADQLKDIYGVATREETIARAIGIAVELSKHADKDGNLIVRDMSQKTALPVSVPMH